MSGKKIKIRKKKNNKNKSYTEVNNYKNEISIGNKRVFTTAILTHIIRKPLRFFSGGSM